jgi:hypothetical protein
VVESDFGATGSLADDDEVNDEDGSGKVKDNDGGVGDGTKSLKNRKRVGNTCVETHAVTNGVKEGILYRLTRLVFVCFFKIFLIFLAKQKSSYPLTTLQHTV